MLLSLLETCSHYRASSTAPIFLRFHRTAPSRTTQTIRPFGLQYEMVTERPTLFTQGSRDTSVSDLPTGGRWLGLLGGAPITHTTCPLRLLQPLPPRPYTC